MPIEILLKGFGFPTILRFDIGGFCTTLLFRGHHSRVITGAPIAAQFGGRFASRNKGAREFLQVGQPFENNLAQLSQLGV